MRSFRCHFKLYIYFTARHRQSLNMRHYHYIAQESNSCSILLNIIIRNLNTCDIEMCPLSNHAIIIYFDVYKSCRTIFHIKNKKIGLFIHVHFLITIYIDMYTIYIFCEIKRIRAVYILFLFSEKLILEIYQLCAELISKSTI